VGDPFQFETSYWTTLSRRLHGLLLQLKGERAQIELKKELGFGVDPWDHYLYFDSVYIMGLLQSPAYFAPSEQLLLLHFALRALETDAAGFLQAPQAEMIADLLAFAR
jgi:hypothetical protein